MVFVTTENCIVRVPLFTNVFTLLDTKLFLEKNFLMVLTLMYILMPVEHIKMHPQVTLMSINSILELINPVMLCAQLYGFPARIMIPIEKELCNTTYYM